MNKELKFRRATKDDLLDIVRMLADDNLGSTREKLSASLSDNYIRAFEIISEDHNQELTVVEMNRELVATFHLSYIQYLTHHGGLRAQIEAVRTNAKYRGQGIGKKIFDYAINRAKERGCVLVQLTTDKQRPEAIRFYKNIGFVATHEGMKFKLH